MAKTRADLGAFSGVWTGYWIQGKIKGIMTVELNLHDGVLTGSGSDRAGTFTLAGSYDNDSGIVNFVKQYTHYPVNYSGKWSGKMIRGQWSFGTAPGGNFRLEPVPKDA